MAAGSADRHFGNTVVVSERKHCMEAHLAMLRNKENTDRGGMIYWECVNNNCTLFEGIVQNTSELMLSIKRKAMSISPSLSTTQGEKVFRWIWPNRPGMR